MLGVGEGRCRRRASVSATLRRSRCPRGPEWLRLVRVARAGRCGRPVRHRRGRSPARMRRRRSMSAPVFSEILYCLYERNAATRAAIDSVHQLIDRGTRSKLPQFREEVLLQRFTFACSPASEYGVCLVREVSYKDVWHSCIMIAPLPGARAGAVRGRSSVFDHPSTLVVLSAGGTGSSNYHP